MNSSAKLTFVMTEVPEEWRTIWGSIAYVPNKNHRHATQSQLDAAKLLKVKYPRDVVGSFSLIN